MRGRVVLPLVCALLLVVAATSFYLGETLGQRSTTTSTSQEAITSYSVCFSPGGDCASEIINAIASANVSVHVVIYTFTNTNIANALVAAKNRGIDVRVVMDASEANSDNLAVVAILNQAGVPLRTYSPNGGIVHDKFAVIDGSIVITGSYNWSYSAENYNDENLLLLHSTELASQYENNFETLWNESQPGG